MTVRLDDRLSALLADPALGSDPFRSVCEELVEERAKLRRRLDRIGRISDGYQSQLRDLNHALLEANEKLSSALSEVKTLSGFIPICTTCKRVRDDEGYWDEVESYLGKRSEAVLSRGVCPSCARGEARAPEVHPSRRSAARGDEEEETARLASVLGSGAYEGNPLLPEHERLSRRFAKLARRLEKISKISDGFQTQLKDLNTALQRASRTDQLTGLANRRAMIERLTGEENRAFRSGRPFILLMIDVDLFKRVNDTWGHEAGDLVLKELAGLFQANVRSFDLCARWGGEEFLVLLLETPPEMAFGAADKLRALAEALVVPYEGHAVRFTFSCGVAVHEPRGHVEETLREADRALYAAKMAGRNRVVLAESL